VLVTFGFSGCALRVAGLGARAAGATGLRAANVAGAGEAAAVGRAALAGDVVAMTRLGAVEGALMTAGEVSALSRMAATRAVARLGVSTPLVEEVAIMRAGGRVLAYPESYPLARANALTVKMPDGSLVGSIRRFDSQVIVRNSSGEIVGETVATTGRFNHYVDAGHSRLRGYSTLDGTTLRHWILDSEGKSVYLGSEIIEARVGVPPVTFAIPAALFAAASQSRNKPREPGADIPRGASFLAESPEDAVNYFLKTLQAGDIDEAYNCLSKKMENWWRASAPDSGIVYDILTEAEPPASVQSFELKNARDQTYGARRRFRVTAIIQSHSRRRILFYVAREEGLWKIKDILDATGTYDWVLKNNNLYPEE
jgi:hypothetical protein